MQPLGTGQWECLTTWLFSKPVSNTFISNATLKLAKSQVKAKLHPDYLHLRGWTFGFCYLEVIRFFDSRYNQKLIGDILKNVQITSI